jgi:hypothetical protein
MKFLSGLSLLFIFACQVSAQITVLGSTQGEGYMNNTVRGVMTEIKPPVREATGSTYINDNWLPGKINLTNGQVIDDVLIRYDIEVDQIEVKIDGTLKGVSGKNIKSLTLLNLTTQSNELYISGNGLMENGNKQTGLFKVITDGAWSLLEKIEVNFVKPSYNPVLDVGEEEPQYVKSSALYIAQGPTIFKVSKKKKKFLESFNEQSDSVSAYMKKMKLSIKDTDDIKLIVEFLNKKV